MSDTVLVHNGATLESRRLCDMLPREGRHGALALEAQVAGFRMTDYESPPGELPSVHFTTHMAGVGVEGRPPCTLLWRSHGVERSRVMNPHTVFTLSEGLCDPLRWNGWLRMLTLSVTPEAMEAVLPEEGQCGRVELMPIRAGEPDLVLSRLFGAIQHEAEGGYLDGRLFIESLCHTTALYLATRYGVRPAKASSRRHGLARDVLSRVCEYVDAYLADELSVITLAKVARLSPYHFGKMFQRSTGVTVHRYVTRLRLLRAQELLRNSDLSLAEIAAAVGFYDQSQMTYIFRRYVGTTPRTYRCQR